MNARHLLVVAALVGLFPIVHADTIVSDNFDGPSLNASLWQTLGPGVVTQSGGWATTTGRGILATQDEFASSVRINGIFSMLDDQEHFSIAFRTDLSSPGAPFHELTGLHVSFSNDGDQISIQRYLSPSDWELLAVKSFSLITGRLYEFTIYDTGTNIDLYVNGIPELSAVSSFETGNKVAMYSREFGAGSSIALTHITGPSVPETGATALLLLMGLAGLAVRRQYA